MDEPAFLEALGQAQTLCHSPLPHYVCASASLEPKASVDAIHWFKKGYELYTAPIYASVSGDILLALASGDCLSALVSCGSEGNPFERQFRPVDHPIFAGFRGTVFTTLICRGPSGQGTPCHRHSIPAELRPG